MDLAAYPVSNRSPEARVQLGSIKLQRNNRGCVETHKSSDADLLLPNRHYVIEPLEIEVIVDAGHRTDQLVHFSISVPNLLNPKRI